MLAVLYDWLKSGHVLMAVVWVGGAIAIQLLAIRINRTGDRAQAYEFSKHVEFVGTRVFMPASLLLVILGLWMVAIGPWNFGLLWVDLGIAMFAFSFVSGAFYIGPSLKRLRQAAESQGAESPAVDAILSKIFLVSRVELVLLVLIVFDMVLKPGG